MAADLNKQQLFIYVSNLFFFCFWKGFFRDNILCVEKLKMVHECHVLKTKTLSVGKKLNKHVHLKKGERKNKKTNKNKNWTERDQKKETKKKCSKC